MKLKEVDRTANVAWSPAAHHPIQLAVGTAAQQLDATFSTTATLELYNLNLGDPSQEMEVMGSLTTDSRFFRLIWSPAGSLLGGAEQGQIFIWDPEKIQNKDSNPLIHHLKKHTGSVSSLDLNPFQNNLVASGAGDSEIFIWDLASIDKVMTPGAKAQPIHDVSCVAWNRQVQHILGSTHGGSCVVWDLRKNEPIIKIRDSMSRIKANTLCWHPDVATQLCIASEDDHTPVIQVWDLRAASSPLRTLEYHQRGILSMSWCPNDSDMLLSCGKDNRILCWNPNSELPTGEVLYELATDAGQWSFDVQWCPRNPAVISSCSFDGHISVHSLMGGGQSAQTSSKVTDAFDVGGMGQPALPSSRQAYPSGDLSGQHAQEPMLTKPPKWLRRPVGATFGFGGKLVCFENMKTATGQQTSSGVTVSQVITSRDLVQRSVALEGALQHGAYADFCGGKIREMEGGKRGDIDQSIWQFLKVNFEENPRLRYLELLGYDSTQTGQQVIDKLEVGKSKKSVQSELNKRATPQPVAEEGDDLSQATNGIAAMDAFGKSDSFSAFESIAKSAAEQDQVQFDDSPIRLDISDDYEGLVTKALLTANFEAAVEAALHFDHLAEAVILASAGGQELLEKTQRRVLCANDGQHSSLNKLISSVVTRDLDCIVRTCEISNWREVLTTILTYADGEEFTTLSNMLGSRLESADKSLSPFAQLCYIVAGNMDKLVDVWCKSLPPNTSQPALQNLVEKVMILKKAVELYQGAVELNSDEMNARLTEYAQLLATEGCATTAYTYLINSNNSHLPIALLKDRLYHSLHPSVFSQAGCMIAAPPRPFQVIDVKRDMQQQWQPQGHQQQGLQQHGLQQQGLQQHGLQQQGLQQQSRVQQQHQPIQRRPSGPAATVQQQRQRTESGNYGAYNPAQAQQQTIQQQNLVQSSHLSRGPVNQPVTGANVGGAYPGQVPQYKPVSTGYDPYAQSGISAGSRGQYPQLVQPVSQPAPLPISTYNPNAYPSSVPNQATMHSGMQAAGMGHQAGPGGPMIPAAELPKTATNWNDPPMVTSSVRKNTRMGGGDHAPGAPSTIDGIQLYNPQEHQLQQPPHQHMGHHQQQQQQWGPSVMQPQMGGGYPGVSSMPPPQASHPSQPPVVEEPKKVVQPIPSEHLILQQVLDKLVHLCINNTNNPQVRKKLEDVLKKLEILYDHLRSGTLSASTLTALHQIVQSIQQYDYATSLACHAELIRVGSFSEISAFMPAVKVLIQTASQHQIYVQ